MFAVLGTHSELANNRSTHTLNLNEKRLCLPMLTNNQFRAAGERGGCFSRPDPYLAYIRN